MNSYFSKPNEVWVWNWGFSNEIEMNIMVVKKEMTRYKIIKTVEKWYLLTGR